MASHNPRRSTTRQLFAVLRVPAITVGLLLIPFAVYYTHVRDQTEYLTSRNFRTLATMSDQIRVTVDNFGSVMDNAYLEAPKANSRLLDRKPELREFLKQGRLECDG